MPVHTAPDFLRLASPCFSRDQLHGHPGTVFGLWPDYRLAYLNPHWHVFAMANGGEPAISQDWPVGRQYFDAIPALLQDFYRNLFTTSPLPGQSLHPVIHEYECSSASVFRKFSMQVYTLPERSGYVVVNALVLEAAHAGQSISGKNHAAGREQVTDLDNYTDDAGLTHQCCHCRCVRNLARPGCWDWIPAWVEHPHPSTSHTICPLCFDYFYPV